MNTLSSPRRQIDTVQVTTHPYSPSPSIASSASSSASSAFSVCSAASSVSDTSIHTVDRERNGWPQEHRGKEGSRHAHPVQTMRVPPLPLEQRQHHRRTNRPGQPCPSEGCQMPSVPALVRQTERKTNFVDNLVDSAAQIVETIWPTYMNGKSESSGGKGVLPLRTFIQETLRRSRTSYSTLQVALYYLIVIRPHIHKGDFSDLERRALQCGRRMFLAALILASKYLQDRNYSARAWSRISGLQTQEININEFAFLNAVNWRLHISEANFQRWTDLVVKYTSGNPATDEARRAEWSKLILKLTPDLTIEGQKSSSEKTSKQGGMGRDVGVAAACPPCADSLTERTTPSSSPAPVVHEARAPTNVPIPKLTVSSLLSNTPDGQQTLPMTLEPQPQTPTFNPLPQSARVSNISPSKTPAARFGSGGSMASAVATAQITQLHRCTTEDMSILPRRGTGAQTLVPTIVRSAMLSRRSSLSCSMTSSPETLNDSDSSGSSSPFAFSRSSSISSASSVDSLPPQSKPRKHSSRLQVSTGKVSPSPSLPSRSSSTDSSSLSEPTLDTPTPSPPKYLPLRPRPSRDSARAVDKSASRKRRLGTEVLDRDTGVSPNCRSGMTPQMKVQLQMRSPQIEGIGSKRLRCGSQESNILTLRSYRGTEEVL